MSSLKRPRDALAPALLVALASAMLALGGPGSAADLALLHAAQVDGLVSAARLVTRLGDGITIFAAAAAGAGLLLWRGAPRRALLLLAIFLSCRLLVEGLKMALDRARPDPAGHLVAIHSMAFPSGHAANSMAVWLAIALLAAPPRLRAPAAALAVAIALAVGLTRLVLGVHWPSDVVGGWALGAAWTLMLVRFAGGGEPTLPRRD